MMIFDAIKKMLLLLALVVMPTMILQAGESYIQTLSGKLKKGDSCTVIDDKFLHLPLADWNRLNHLSVDNIISFELRFDTAVMYYSRPFSCKLNVSIKYFTSRDQQTPDEINNIDLVIKYDTAKGSTFPSNAFYKFKNAFKVVVVINSITSQEWGQAIPAAFRLKNQILVERKYPFSPAVNGGIHLSTGDGSSDGPDGGGMMAQRLAVGKTEKQLTVSWGATDFDNAEEYDVEWAYIDGASTTATDILTTYTQGGVINIPDVIMAGWMRFNATRVTVPALKYTINIPYRDGYILFRVRGVYHRLETGVREHSPWVYQDVEGSRSLAMRIEETDALEPGLTWQYIAAFGEEGKRREVITYYDGSLRSRQSVTLSNSDQTLKQGSTTLREETAIVQETIYDMMGREAMNILPAPVKSKNIGYYRAFNRNSSDVPLSHDDIQLYKNTLEASCAIGAGDLTSTPGATYNYAGASQYYSPNNPFLGDNQFYFTQFVPDAEKRPYSLTQYTADNTGRVKAQGGPGKTLLIENGRGTQYHYGKPAQKELDRLFGSEAGNASHYLKNMVVDPNKQVSVSYIDINGKTIATALAGDPAKSTQGIKSATDAGAKTSMNQRLVSAGDFRRDAAGMVMQSSSTFLAPMPGTYQVNYNVSPASLTTTHNQGQFCSNCSYEVVVQVVDDCGGIRGQTVSPAFTGNDITCNPSAVAATGIVNVDANKLGEYSVNITLRLSEEVVKYQEDYYVEHNSDLKTLQAFFDAELLKLDLAGCYTTCEQCKTLGNTDAEFKAKVLELLGTEKFAGISPAAVNTWISNTWLDLKQKCSLLNCSVSSACDDYLLQMKADVKAGGQYALYTYNETTGQYALQEPSINAMQYYTQHNLPYTLENGGTANGNTLSVSDFIKTYLTHPEWADELVKHHVEYCAYEWCKDAGNANRNEASYNFDKTLRERVLTGEDAQIGNYYNRSNMLALLQLDPFFSIGGKGVDWSDEMQQDLATLSTIVGVVIKDNNGNALPAKDIFGLIDWMLYCKPAGSTSQALIINSWSNCTVTGSCRSVTAEWELYRNYYLQLKSKYVRIVKELEIPSCKDCFIGRDVLAQPACVDPGPLSRYKTVIAIVGNTGNATVGYGEDPEDLGGSLPFRDNYRMKVRYKVNGEWFEDFVTLEKGATSASFIIPYANFTEFSVAEVKCMIGGGLQNCSDSGATDPGPCPDMGNFEYREEAEDDTNERWDVSQVYYVSQGGPVTRPVTITVGRSMYNVIYGTTYYEYPVILDPGQSEVHIGENATVFSDNGDGVTGEEDITYYDVWVVSVSCPPVNVIPQPRSTCTDDPNYAAYKDKSRVFNDFIAVETYVACQAANPPANPSEAEILSNLRFQAIAQLVFLKTNWKERLMTVRDEEPAFSSISNATINQLTDALHAIARKNIEAATTTATIRPASVLPPGITVSGYNSFQGAFNNFISTSLIQQGFSPYLLDKPYPYNKTPIEANPNVQELSADICTNLATLRSRFTASGSSNFHNWLKGQLGEDYMLTEAQLTGLESRCSNSCRYLEQPLILPAAMATPAYSNSDHPFVDCNRINTLTSEFAGLFPSLDPAGKLYRTLLANFLNHKLGYALGYSEYVLFKKNCTSSPTAVLYNKPASPVLLPDNLLCVADNIKAAYERAGQDYDRYITIERKRFRNQYIAKCIGNSAFADLTGDVYEYHYTLYYYDQSGNLVKTIPPEGVRLLSNVDIEKVRECRELGTACNGAPQTEQFIVPQHGLPSYYAYNSLNKVVQQTSPDGGTSHFWYDRLGRIVITQHDEQLQSSTGDADNRYSYTVYDALGRISEVGEKTASNKTVTEVQARTESFMNEFYGAGANRQVTQTLYDESPVGAPGLLTNLRKRVAARIYKETGSGPIQQASYFNYDILGNIKTLYQYNLQLVTADAATGIKRIDYEYDLAIGKINMVKYQEGKGDQFFHKYLYDADNRVIAAYTSRNKLIWNTEATYRYYLHGPLARLELGNDNGSTGKVQGVDYAYTIQGWLKGVNSQKLDVNADMAKDGKAGGDFALYARDVMGFSLGYFDKDYTAIGGGAAFSMKYLHPTTLPNAGTGNELFNGNISNTTLAISKLDNGAVKGYTYRHDQLNRLVQMRMHAIGGSASNWNNTGILDMYKEDIKYDGNGNIMEYTRHGNKPDKLLMDKLTYNYNRDGAQQLINNRLQYVQDAVGDGDYTNDIDGQGSDNYAYDKAGNLIKDTKENLTSIEWTAYGKIARVKKGESGSIPASDVTTIDYSYDANGYRVGKSVKVEKASGQTTTTKTFYVRDPQGNVMGLYKLGNDNKLWWQEQHLYGSSRLGIWKPGIEVTATWQAPGEGAGAVVLGQRNYELTNHLGNVLAVITDKKNPVSGGGYEAEVLTATDYYPFGMQMPGRSLEGAGCHDVVQDLTELVASSDLNSGATTLPGNKYVQNGITWQGQANGIVTLYNNQAIRVENSGTTGSDGVLALVPSSMLLPFTTYIMECDIVDQSPTITGFGINAQSNTLDPYRSSKEVTVGGHHSIIFTTGATIGSWVGLRISARPTTAGLYFVVDNFTIRRYTVVNQTQVPAHVTDFNTAVMDGVNVNDKGQLWKPFNTSITSLSVTGTTDRKIQVNCTNVPDSRLNTEFNNIAGGDKYLVKFTVGQEAGKWIFLQLSSRTGTGVWTFFQQGIFYTGSGNYQFNFTIPAGADQLRVEFLRTNTGSAADGLNVPYTIDNFSLTRIEPIASQTTIVCDPGADPTGDNSIYRYGFNGKENDNEVKGGGNQVDFGTRVYDPRLGRFLSVDPLIHNIPFYSPYLFAGDKPTAAIDKDGEVEVVIHHIVYGRDGKTVIKEYTNRIIIETVEDIRGIIRDPINVLIVERMTSTTSQFGGGTVTYDMPVAQYAKVSGGESYEDRMWKGWEGSMSKWVYKGMKKFWPPAKLNDAWVNEDRDPVNNELRDPSQKYLQTAEAIIDMISIGKSAVAKGGLEKLIESQGKKIIDWGREELLKKVVKKLGLDKEKSAILGYYIIKYANERKIGKLTEAFKIFEAVVKLGTKTSEAIGELKRIGISFDMPNGKDDAVKEALKWSGEENLPVNDQ